MVDGVLSREASGSTNHDENPKPEDGRSIVGRISASRCTGDFTPA